MKFCIKSLDGLQIEMSVGRISLSPAPLYTQLVGMNAGFASGGMGTKIRFVVSDGTSVSMTFYLPDPLPHFASNWVGMGAGFASGRARMGTKIRFVIGDGGKREYDLIPARPPPLII